MASKDTKKRIREEVQADQARYDENTRLLEERIAYHRARLEEERAEAEPKTKPRSR
jgi:hypothetical protein